MIEKVAWYSQINFDWKVISLKKLYVKKKGFWGVLIRNYVLLKTNLSDKEQSRSPESIYWLHQDISG